jgi:hypothetical protein
MYGTKSFLLYFYPNSNWNLCNILRELFAEGSNVGKFEFIKEKSRTFQHGFLIVI